jgi:hypothetical protein
VILPRCFLKAFYGERRQAVDKFVSKGTVDRPLVAEGYEGGIYYPAGFLQTLWLHDMASKTTPTEPVCVLNQEIVHKNLEIIYIFYLQLKFP